MDQAQPSVAQRGGAELVARRRARRRVRAAVVRAVRGVRAKRARAHTHTPRVSRGGCGLGVRARFAHPIGRKLVPRCSASSTKVSRAVAYRRSIAHRARRPAQHVRGDCGTSLRIRHRHSPTTRCRWMRCDPIQTSRTPPRRGRDRRRATRGRSDQITQLRATKGPAHAGAREPSVCSRPRVARPRPAPAQGPAARRPRSVRRTRRHRLTDNATTTRRPQPPGRTTPGGTRAANPAAIAKIDPPHSADARRVELRARLARNVRPTGRT